MNYSAIGIIFAGMAQSMNRGGRFMIGDYVIVKQIGTGSFSTVWHGCHRVDGTDVAIKEIATARLDPKLRESLKSEIIILQKINHPNIIRLHDMIEVPLLNSNSISAF